MNLGENKYKSKEVDEFISALESFQLKLRNNPAASKKFLVDIGVLTKKGNLKKNYSELCIHKEQE